ncbi:MAG: hypothetical protein JWO51_1071 [Rhodospirillales bacterium]|nr:hypothetical protein [Rhodospirillales bacterium]
MLSKTPDLPREGSPRSSEPEGSSEQDCGAQPDPSFRALDIDRFRECSETSSDWLWEQDEELRFRWFFNVNAPADVHVAHQGFGKTRWEIVDRGVSEAEWARHKADLYARRPFHDFRFERLGDEGTVHFVTVSGRPFFDKGGVFRGYRGSCRDITTQVRAQHAAEAANRAKSEFLANMSHELRTPLNAVLGFAELIRDGLADDRTSRYSDYASDIHAAGHHLLQIINDILDISKIESGHMVLRDDLVDVKDSIGASCGILAERAKSGEVQVEQSVSPDLPPLRADPLRIRQILLNLCGNAIKFTPAGGTVRIEASRRAEGGLVIAIADTGIGMAPAGISKALEPFGQVDSGLSRRFGGTGLGLPIAKALTELHGGTLEVTSSPGVGTVVNLRFPAERFVGEPLDGRKLAR